MYAFPSQFSYCASLKPEIIEEESKMGSEKKTKKQIGNGTKKVLERERNEPKTF